MKTTNRLQGKYILITGASQGLGKQLAIDFAQAGSAGIAILARDGEALEKLRQVIYEIAPQTKVLTISADLTKPEDIERTVATTLSKFDGKLDVLVNNASTIGLSPMPYLLDYPVFGFSQRNQHQLNRAILVNKKSIASDD